MKYKMNFMCNKQCLTFILLLFSNSIFAQTNSARLNRYLVVEPLGFSINNRYAQKEIDDFGSEAYFHPNGSFKNRAKACEFLSGVYFHQYLKNSNLGFSLGAGFGGGNVTILGNTATISSKNPSFNLPAEEEEYHFEKVNLDTRSIYFPVGVLYSLSPKKIYMALQFELIPGFIVSKEAEATIYFNEYLPPSFNPAFGNFSSSIIRHPVEGSAAQQSIETYFLNKIDRFSLSGRLQFLFNVPLSEVLGLEWGVGFTSHFKSKFHDLLAYKSLGVFFSLGMEISLN